MGDSGKDSTARPNLVGARLQAARERAELTQVEAAEMLHVDPGVIQALESEKFSQLGAAVYVRGHLRHYAELLKESAPELLNLYAASVSGAPPDLTLMPHVKQTSSWRGALAMTGIALVIGVGLIGSIRWIYLDLHPAAVASPAASAPAPPALPADVTDITAPASAAPTPASVADVVAAPASAARSAKRALAANANAEASVTLKFKSACWTEVYDAHGTALFHAIGAAGVIQTIHGLAPLKVMVGNFPEVQVEVDGQAQGIPADAKSGRVATFLVTHEGVLQPAQRVASADNSN